jgi:hypothetical protein
MPDVMPCGQVSARVRIMLKQQLAEAQRRLRKLESEQQAAPIAAFTIAEFCAAHRLSRALFYKLTVQGRGPRVTPLGSQKRVIMIEDAAAWRAERAAASEAL